LALAPSLPRRELRKPFRLAFRSPAAPEPLAPAADVAPEIDFVAYAADCLLSGRVSLNADRLSDLLNRHNQFELVDVLVTDLLGGAPIQIHELLVGRDEVLLVHANGPRGRADQRRRTRQIPVVAMVGPYEVHGYMHALPGADPIASLRADRPVVAVTDADVAYSVGGITQRRRVSTLLMNWQLADTIVEDLAKIDSDGLEVHDDARAHGALGGAAA
jgi:hypothetical protein